jgi:hypothetical protein
MMGRFGATAFAVAAVVAFARPASSQPPAPPPPGCIAALKDVHTGSGAKSFASHYVTIGDYGYGEFSAGGFGGQSLWLRRGTGWCRVQTAATPLDANALRAFGVPAATADRLIAAMRKTPEIAPVPQRSPHR